MSVELWAMFWLMKFTFDDFSRLWAAWKLEMHGDIDGVLVWLLLRSHWSSSWRSSSADGPPPDDFWTVNDENQENWTKKSSAYLPNSPLLKSSSAVVKSHHWIVPLQCPVNKNRLGRDPILVQDPSHSWTQNDVIVVESTDFITQTRSPLEASRTKTLSASGTTFCTMICSSSCSPKGPKSFPAR